MQNKCPSHTPDWFLGRVRRHPKFALVVALHHWSKAAHLQCVLHQINDWKTRVHLAGLIRFHEENAKLARDFLGGLGCKEDPSFH